MKWRYHSRRSEQQIAYLSDMILKRDGWAILQASTFEWSADDEVCDPDWQEVAFVQAWGREKKEEEQI
jgi:gentisate 1,2-dioxygenase